jgi:MarR family transcriptional regulator, organic hydroperoxide resistance regulator
VAKEMPTPGFLVWRLSMRWRAAVDRAVAPLGITHAQYSVLASLYGMNRRGEQPSQRQLAEHTGLEPIYVSKLVRTLERAGLVERPGDPADSRAVRLALTRAGNDTARRAIKIVAELLQHLLAPLGGVRSPRTQAFVAELQTLLAAPLSPQPEGAD